VRTVFYGWYVVAAAFLIAVWGWGLGFYGPTIYLVILRDAHGWSVATISGAVTAYYLVGAAMIAPLGRVVRRFGPASTLLIGVSAMAAAVTSLTLIWEPWQLYLAFFVMAIGWATMSTAMVNILVAPWFDRKLGLALGLAMNGASFGGIVIAPAVLLLVQLIGPARGLRVAAVAMLIMLVPLALTVARRHLGQLGLAPDGDVTGPTPRSAPAQGATRRTPYRTLAYWTISIPFGLGLAAQVGFLMHEVAFLTPILGLGGAGMALSLTTVVAVVGRVLLGSGGDRMPPRRAAALTFLIQIGGLALLVWRPSVLVVYAGCILVGFAVGSMTTLPGLLVQREFPGGQFASTVSSIVATNQVVYAFSPGVIGLLRDATGSYTAALWMCITLLALATIVVLIERGPSRRGTSPRPTGPSSELISGASAGR
jgi:MFS family permease